MGSVANSPVIKVSVVPDNLEAHRDSDAEAQKHQRDRSYDPEEKI